MTRQQLIDDITAKIRQNGNQDITGDILQGVLLNMVNAAGIIGQDAGLRDYQPLRTYQPGEAAIFSGQVFRCMEQTSGTFNASHWQIISRINVVQTIAQRNAIVHRFEGMQCYVRDTMTTYQLTGGTSNDHWQPPAQAEIHIFHWQPSQNGLQTFTVPDRPLLLFMINGIAYPPGTYQLDNGNGTTQQLTWTNIDAFGLETDDTLLLLYKGSEVSL